MPTCPAGPLTLTAFLAADGRCYVTDAVEIAGWWDMPRPNDPGAIDAPWDVLRGRLPFGSVAELIDGIRMDLSAETVGLSWESATWAVVTARRSPPQERHCYRDPVADVNAPPICPDHLVVSKVVETTPPDAELAACAVAFEDVPIDVDTFTSFPAVCFGARDVELRGWLDIRYVITGWEAPYGLEPGWLWFPIGPWTVLSPGSNADHPQALKLYFDPARHVTAGRTNRWVTVRGHYGDPAIAACHYVYADWYVPAEHGPKLDDALALRTCRDRFVVTSIKNTNP